jgi:hypothetical protein
MEALASQLCECGCGQITTISPKNVTRFGYIEGQPRRFANGHNSRTRKYRLAVESRLCECGCGQPTPLATRTEARMGYVKYRPRRFIHGHNSARRSITESDYTVENRGYETPCWLWNGKRRNGYGVLTMNGRECTAHRAMYEQEVAPIPDDHHLHHLCRSKACIRPSHTAPLTPGDHSRLHLAERWS